MLSKIAGIKQMLSGKDPQILYDSMMKSNPQFAQFVQQNQGKSLEDIANELGVDLNMIRSLLG